MFLENWFKVQFVCYIKVCRDCFWVIVNYNGFVFGFFDGYQIVNIVVIKFNVLFDMVRARVKDYDFFFVGRGDIFVFFIEGRVEVGCLCFKFSSIGVYYFVGVVDVQFFVVVIDFFIFNVQQLGNLSVRIFNFFELVQEIFWDVFCYVVVYQLLFYFDQLFNLFDKLGVNVGEFVDGFFWYVEVQCIFKLEDVVFIWFFQVFQYICCMYLFFFVGIQAYVVIFEGLVGFL